MSSVTLSLGSRSLTVDLVASRTWRVPSSGQAGQATLRIPRNSPASSPNYLDPNGGTVVTIHGMNGCGEWTGIVLPFSYDGWTTEITAWQVSKLLGQRIIQRTATLRNLTAGMAATVVLREALTGVRGLSLVNAPFEGGVLATRDVTLDGQDAWGALSSLMDLSDGEVHITSSGQVNWCGPLAYAPRYDELLIAGSTLRDARVTVSGEGRVSEVIAGSGPTRYTARRGDSAARGWPAQAVINVDGGAFAAAQAAEVEMTKRGQPAITVAGAVSRAHWAIRERMFVQVLVPWVLAGSASGATYRCRVLARTIADDSPDMPLELQVIHPTPGTATTAGSGARQPAPARPSASGEGGSFAQQYRALRRAVARLERVG